MSLQQFIKGGFTIFGGDMQQKAEEVKARCEMLEPYQLGLKPFAVMVTNTARKGSIVRLSANFKRAGIAYSVGTSETGPFGNQVYNTERVDADKPTILPYQSYSMITKGMEDRLAFGGFLAAYHDSTLKFLLDDGTDVTSKFGLNAQFTVMLDYDGPTEMKFTKKAKAEEVVPPTYTDRFGAEINVNDMVVFAEKEYNSGGMTGAGVNFGKVVKYLPKGGMVINTLQGYEVRLMTLAGDTVAKVDKDLMDRMMTAKLAG